MFCPSCGTEAPPGLNYCKRCGLNIGRMLGDQPQPQRLSSLFWSVAVFGIAGLMVLVGAALGFAGMGFSSDVAIVMLVFGFTTIGLISYLLIKQVSRLIDVSQGLAPSRKAVDSRSIEQQAGQLAPPPRVISSVTEQTTRNFDLSGKGENTSN